MDYQMFDRDRISQIYFGKVCVVDKSTIHQNYKSRSQCFHPLPVQDEKSCIFTETDAQHHGIADNGLEQSPDASPVNKMSVDDNVINESQPAGNLYFAFQQRFCR